MQADDAQSFRVWYVSERRKGTTAERRSEMRHERAAWVMAVAAMAVMLGCEQLDPAQVGYGAARRAGVSSVGYAPFIGTSTGWNLGQPEELGFQSASGTSLWFSQPLVQHFDLRAVIDFGTWKVQPNENWPDQDIDVLWNTTAVTVLLCVGGNWDRFGVFYRTGTGYVFNDPEWPSRGAAATGALSLQMEFGASVLATEYLEFELALGYRAARCVFELDSVERDQILEAALVKVGVQYVF
jgi:hypothetical protein